MQLQTRQGLMMAVIAAALLVTGALWLARTEADCGEGQKVGPGGVCEQSGIAYERAKSAQDLLGWVILGGGAVCLGVAGAGFAQGRRRSRLEKASIASVEAFMTGSRR